MNCAIANFEMIYFKLQFLSDKNLSMHGWKYFSFDFFQIAIGKKMHFFASQISSSIFVLSKNLYDCDNFEKLIEILVNCLL